jgi:hypothetical protein
MHVGLTLDQWGDIAQIAIAISAALALIVAAIELWRSRANARRVRAYEYSDRFNQPEMRRRAGEYREYFEDQKRTYDDFVALKRTERNELTLLPNLIEEVAALYVRKLIDRYVAAETLGPYVEELWEVSKVFAMRVRADQGPACFVDWESMVEDTPGRRAKANAKMARRRAWRKLVRGA